MTKTPAKYQVYGLQENYIDLGKNTLKVVISPRFKSGHDFSISLVDSDGKKMKYVIEHWGRKLNVEFEICEDTPDGLASCIIKRGEEDMVMYLKG